MQSTVTLMTALLLAPLAAATAADPTTTLWFDKPATSFHQSLPLGQRAHRRDGLWRRGRGADRAQRKLRLVRLARGRRPARRAPGAAGNPPAACWKARTSRPRGWSTPTSPARARAPATANGANVPFGCYQTLGNLRLKFGNAAQRTGAAVRQRTSRVVGQPGDRVLDWTATRTRNGASSTKAGPWSGTSTPARTARRPREYRLTSAEDVPARDPRTWKLEGSTDGKTWTLLDEHKDEPLFAQRHETRSYPIAKPAACRFFRFTFMPNPGVTHFQVAEIALDGVTARRIAAGSGGGILAHAGPSLGLGHGGLPGGRGALHPRAFHQRARRGLRLAPDRRPAGLAVVHRRCWTGRNGSRPRPPAATNC